MRYTEGVVVGGKAEGLPMTSERSGYNALIVGEDVQTFQIVREHLARVAFRVRTVDNGWDALKSVKDMPPDVVVAELSMMDMDGCSLRERFLLDPGIRDIPFVFLTVDGGSERQIRALRMGVDDCIVKPFDPVVIVARIEAVLARRRAYEEMVRVDPLTRVLNRPSVEREIRDELARLVRYNRMASFALLDMDDFSDINGEHGHAMGDLLLTCLGGIILTNVRGADIAGRMRGEKFIVYLPETPREGARTLILRILERFAAAADAIAGISTSFSTGIAEAPAGGQHWAELCEHANAALGEAKRQGKNRVVAWEKTE